MMHIVQTLRSLVKPTWHKLPVGKLQRTVRGTPKQLKTFQNWSLHKLLLLEACLGIRVCSKDLSPFNTTSTAKQKASALAHHQAEGLKEITTTKTVKNQVQLLYLLLNQDTVYSIFRSELQGRHWSLNQSFADQTHRAEATSQHPRVGAFWRWQSNGESKKFWTGPFEQTPWDPELLSGSRARALNPPNLISKRRTRARTQVKFTAGAGSVQKVLFKIS